LARPLAKAMMDTAKRRDRQEEELATRPTARRVCALAVVLLAGCHGGRSAAKSSASASPGGGTATSSPAPAGGTATSTTGTFPVSGTVVRPFDRASYVSPLDAPSSAEVSAAGGTAPFLAAHGCEPRFSTNFADLVAGAPVQVKNGNGDVIGTGSLGPPTYDAGHDQCVFRFTVANVPALNAYTLAVAQRPDISYPADQVKSPLTITFST
jgi:hypothetical protein